MGLVRIDGSYGEGGGQVLRTSLALSIITGLPVAIERIRAGRPRPGLAAQHLAAVRAAAEVSRARVEGARKGSTALTFEPAGVRPGRYRLDIGTAGAATLVLQTVALPLALAPGGSEVWITGGTHVPWSPPFHYLELQWAPVLREVGVHVDLDLEAAGFFPRGGGRVRALVTPASPPLRSLRRVDRGALVRVEGLAGSARLPGHVTERMARAAREGLDRLGCPVEVGRVRLEAPSPGAFLVLRAVCEGATLTASALGERGKPAEQVAAEAVSELCRMLETGACTDPHLPDQLLLPLALARGESELTTARVTRHLTTNAWVIRRFLPDAAIEVDGEEGFPGRVRVRGTGLGTRAPQGGCSPCPAVGTMGAPTGGSRRLP